MCVAAVSGMGVIKPIPEYGFNDLLVCLCRPWRDRNLCGNVKSETFRRCLALICELIEYKRMIIVLTNHENSSSPFSSFLPVQNMNRAGLEQLS